MFNCHVVNCSHLDLALLLVVKCELKKLNLEDERRSEILVKTKFRCALEIKLCVNVTRRPFSVVFVG